MGKQLLFAQAIFAKKKPTDAERASHGRLSLKRESNSYENRCCSNNE